MYYLLIIMECISDKTPQKKKKTTTSAITMQPPEAPLVEAPTEYNRREWKIVKEAFDDLSDAIEGMKIPVENADGDFIIEQETEGILNIVLFTKIHYF